jgi:hypothetical protein
MQANAHLINDLNHEPKKIDALYGDGSNSQSFGVLTFIQLAFSEEVYRESTGG